MIRIDGGPSGRIRVIGSLEGPCVAVLAEEIGADLVAMGAPPRGTSIGLGFSPLRTAQHRVLDALDTPVLIVPMSDERPFEE